MNSFTFAVSALATLLPLHVVYAQPVWTPIPVGNQSACSTSPGGPSAPSNCDWGSVTQQIPVQALPSPSSPAYMYNPGVGNDPQTTQLVYLTDCYYLNGSPGEYGGPNTWLYGGPGSYVQPGAQCAVGPIYPLQSAYINWWDAGYGLAFYGSFQGYSDNNDTTAGVYYTDQQTSQAGREYGVRYVWPGISYSSGQLQLYWSSNTNCGGQCYSSGSPYPPSSEMFANVNACTVDTNPNDTYNISPFTPYIYEIWFSAVGSSTYVNCLIFNSAEQPLTNNYFTGPSNFTFDPATGIFSGPIDSWFPYPPTHDGEFNGAGYYTQAILPSVVNPNGNAYMTIYYLKVAK
jgi:hypothetical protein